MTPFGLNAVVEGQMGKQENSTTFVLVKLEQVKCHTMIGLVCALVVPRATLFICYR